MKESQRRKQKRGALDLEHLDVGDAEIEVGGVAKDEASAEKKADGEDGTDEHVLCEVDVLRAIEEARRPLEYARAGCL